jgi:hypothetical protein
LGKYHAPVLGGYAKSHPQTIDTAQTRHAMRALGIGKIVVTPTLDGWSFAGDGNLAGMVHSGSVRAPIPPQRRARWGASKLHAGSMDAKALGAGRARWLRRPGCAHYMRFNWCWRRWQS